MSDSYVIGCMRCREALTIGQAAGGEPFCFYSGEGETMEELKLFFYKHFQHPLICDFSDVFEDRFKGDRDG